MRTMSAAFARISSVSAITWPGATEGAGAGAATVTGAGAGAGAAGAGVVAAAVVMPGMVSCLPGKIRLEGPRPLALSTALVGTPNFAAMPLTVSPFAMVYFVAPAETGAGAGAGAGAAAAAPSASTWPGKMRLFQLSPLRASTLAVERPKRA